MAKKAMAVSAPEPTVCFYCLNDKPTSELNAVLLLLDTDGTKVREVVYACGDCLEAEGLGYCEGCCAYTGTEWDFEAKQEVCDVCRSTP